MTTLIYTYADAAYDMFAVPYAWFALRANDDAVVEILLEDLDDFLERNAESVARLDKRFPGRCLFRALPRWCSERAMTPNVVRFVVEPVTRADYLYIGDIDLLVMENVTTVHLGLMERYGLQFSNVIRPASIDTDQPRLTGLHFCPYAAMLPLPDIADLDLAALNDEHVLHEIMRRKGHAVPESFDVRPECGIHMSLSRDPGGRTSGSGMDPWLAEKRPGWSGGQHDAALLALMEEADFRDIYPTFDYAFRVLAIALEGRARNVRRSLHRIALSYLIDRRVILERVAYASSGLDAERGEAIRAGRLDEAERLSAQACTTWPTRPKVWLDRAWIGFARGRDAVGIECLHHVLDLPGGRELVERTGFIESVRARIEGDGSGGALLGRIDGPLPVTFDSPDPPSAAAA